jgi:hypothetical protein
MNASMRETFRLVFGSARSWMSLARMIVWCLCGLHLLGSPLEVLSRSVPGDVLGTNHPPALETTMGFSPEVSQPSKAIEDVKVGDFVLARDIHSGRVEPRRVLSEFFQAERGHRTRLTRGSYRSSRMVKRRSRPSRLRLTCRKEVGTLRGSNAAPH